MPKSPASRPASGQASAICPCAPATGSRASGSSPTGDPPYSPSLPAARTVRSPSVADHVTRIRGLPAPPSSLIGREEDVDRLLDLLARSRIVTVTGPGGVGKSRLALEVARQLAPAFTNGAAFVGLADLDDPELVGTEIARSLDLVDVSGPEPDDGLHSALRSLRMLLVIDNFEQLVAAAPVLAALTAECPEIAVLVTSRRRLGISAERVFELAPLPVPAKDGRSHPTEAASVALFCERASAVSSQFHPDV